MRGLCPATSPEGPYMTTLQTIGMDFGYTRDICILKGIDLEMCNPQLISVIGPNGAGKTTLIHCLNKLLSPTKGTVLIDERDVSGYKAKELAKKIGYVPYTSGDSFPMSVVDTVLMGRNPHRKWNTLHDDMRIVEEALEMMDISDLAMRPFNELSAGQHQRVMLARGLAQQPEVLLLDEPTANLDIKHQMDVIRLLKKQSVLRGIMVVMISHDINIAAKYSDNIIMMRDGEIFAVGTPQDVITAENIKAVYGVDSHLIDHGGRPHVILDDPDFNEEDARTLEGSYVVSGSRRCHRPLFSRGEVCERCEDEDRIHGRLRHIDIHNSGDRTVDQRPRPRIPGFVQHHPGPHPRKNVRAP